MDPTLVAYLTFTTILVITPGSTTAVVVRNTLIGGRGAGVAAALGAAAGNTSHATAAALGVAVLVARWPAALTVVRVAGAVYLAWLGIQSLRRVVHHADGGLRIDRASPLRGTARSHNGSFRQGLAVNLLNPAIATFYLVVVPSFIPSDASRARFAALATMHVAMALACHCLWAFALDTLRHWFAAPIARRLLEAATGVALIVLAIRVVI